MSASCKIILFLTLLVVNNEASRILAVFPTPSISHQVVFRPLISKLVKNGHEVVLLTTDPVYKKGEGPANLKEINLHDSSYQIWKEDFLNAKVTKGDKDEAIDQGQAAFELMDTVFEHQFNIDEVQAIIKDKTQKFDLLLLEAYFSPLLGFTHRFKAPVILISSFGSTADNLKIVGAPTHPFLYPTFVHRKVGNLTTLDKMSGLFIEHRMEEFMKVYEIKWNKLVQRLFGEGVPLLQELRKNVDMLFLNVHPIWEMNRPVPPNVIYMGGLHQNPSKELPKDLKEYLDSSKHGVIYVSFGTNVEPALFAPEKIQAFIKAFSAFPYDILWKWNKDELPGKSQNIKISKWLPQSDLLKHPKVKLFITQGGLQSTDEAITAGVPLIGMPMMADQWYNVDQYVHFKIGMRIDIDTLTEEKLSNAIHTVINNKSFRDNIVRLRAIMEDQPLSALERATWWTEYVLRYGGAKHLRAPSANLSWTEYYEIELISYVLLALVLIISISCITTYKFFKLLFCKKTKVDKKKKDKRN